jgi:hypothetical protein
MIDTSNLLRLVIPALSGTFWMVAWTEEPPPVESPPPKKPAWQIKFEKIEKKRISFHFADTPLEDVIAFFQCCAGPTLIMDPHVEAAKNPITLKVSKMTFGNALKWVCRLEGLEYAPLDGIVFISTKERIAEGPYRHPPCPNMKLRLKLDREISFDLVKTPLSKVAGFLEKLTEAKFQFDAGVSPEKIMITLKLSQVPLRQALAWIVRLHGLEYGFAHGAVRIQRKSLPPR